MKGNMIFGIYGHNETSISSCMAVPFNDIQPIWNKICINLQKRILSPQSTKVLLGYVVMYAKIYIWAKWDLGTLGGIGPNIEKMVHHYGLCKIKYS